MRSKVSKDVQQRNAEIMTAVQQKIASFGIPDAENDRHRQMEFDYANGKRHHAAMWRATPSKSS